MGDKGTIIYYGGFSLPDKNASANRVVSNGKIFEAIGYRVVFLGADYEDSGYEGVKIVGENMLCEAHPSGAVQWLKQIIFFKNLKNLISQDKTVKLVILYNVPFITLLLAKQFLKKYHVEVAYDCTEWTRFTEGSFVKRAFKYIDEFFVSGLVHLVAHRVIVISEMMMKAYKSSKKIIKLPPLVDISDPMWHQVPEKGNEAFTFCFAGFPGGNKEYLDKVVEAFSSLNIEARLKIVGVDREQFLELYPGTTIGQGVEFLGLLSHSESIKEILSCDCYVFIRPSDRRNNAGFPTKFVESFTCGVKIITTDVSDVKSYADEDCIILQSTDVAEITSAMETIMHSGRGSYNRVLRNAFDYRNYIDETQRWLS